MLNIQKRMLFQVLLGFFLGRVNLFGINPVGVAYFAASYTETGAKLPVGIAVFLGMVTAFSPEKALSAGMAMLVLVLAVDFLEKRKFTVRMGHAALILAAAVAVFQAFRLTLMFHLQYEVWLAGLDSVLTLVCTRVLFDGIHFLLHARKGQGLGNEEIISLVLLGAFGVLGIPDIMIADISLIWTATLFLTLVMGYCYGTGAGAIAGAIGGCVLVVSGQESSMIGITALLGICAGMLREQGKLLMAAAWLIAAVALCYLVSREMMQFGDLEGLAIAGGIFLLIPEKILGKISIRAGGWEDKWESEQLQTLLRHKLLDFSQSFQNLSRTMSHSSAQEEQGKKAEVRRLWGLISEELCNRCEHCENCSGQLSLLRPEMAGMLAAAQEQGQIVLENMPVEFAKTCVHKERFLLEANQNLHLANMNRGFQNRMLQNQKILAGQMREVSEIVEELSDKLPVVRKLPDETLERIEKELRRNRVMLGHIAFYEKYDGRLEIKLSGRTGRGRFVTTREVGEMISAILGFTVTAKEECRKVFSREEESFIFEESARLRAVTGISRVPKTGEEVSGDTFSCMHLPSGELLMALSDGMGTGDAACEESEQVIEMLEQMTEAGFSEISAIKLINSAYMSQEEKRSFATADVAVFNLYQKSGQFLKCGASTTYLCHSEGMDEIEGEALPIGVMNDFEPYLRKCSISAGDYVIMMTDGVADCFPPGEYRLENRIWEYFSDRIGPQELSERILQDALECQDGDPVDDMSVMAVAFYEDTNCRAK